MKRAELSEGHAKAEAEEQPRQARPKKREVRLTRTILLASKAHFFGLPTPHHRVVGRLFYQYAAREVQVRFLGWALNGSGVSSTDGLTQPPARSRDLEVCEELSSSTLS